ncbi:thiol peroxidase [Candidatus Magnetominusculus xianensis]|uniref:Thiol peroxidase n=1 Tax=Candidatus Magnetominusculus xianensis TaxID=1748249 RepID=A0ABR5SHI8_9BACT|nr:thiol peroxidase [Candidatus Magnetominusculus xianensis]KWT91570.1 2-Cys peroxiredoxin [Candidatus Magnetominusculus xianensis]MBF0404355.1 thiol peroxidase [Nitrospirota bacterium]
MERTGVITFQGGGLTLLGTEVKVGDKAPGFTVLDNGLGAVALKDFAGKTVVISVTPSLDTPVCDTQLRKFNESAASLGTDTVVLNLSMDLPFANARFCTTAGIDKVKTLSDYKDAEFGMAYGLLIKELRLLTRAIVIIDKSGTIKYVEVVPEVTNQPNYDKALAALK